jgi:hypothetical protein
MPQILPVLGTLILPPDDWTPTAAIYALAHYAGWPIAASGNFKPRGCSAPLLFVVVAANENIHPWTQNVWNVALWRLMAEKMGWSFAVMEKVVGSSCLGNSMTTAPRLPVGETLRAKA